MRMKQFTKGLMMSAFMLAPIALSAPLQAATPGNVLVIAGRIDDIVTVDPGEVFEFAGSDMARNIYDRLVMFDPLNLDKGYGPGLAESWTISEDGKTFTFKMRKGIKFHSGNPVTAHDAAWSLQRAVIMKKTPSFILTQFGFNKDNAKETIKATDDMTLVITMDKKYAPSFVLNCLTATIGGIVDSKLAMSHEKDGDMAAGWLKLNTAGSGAYKLKNWKPNESYSLERVDGYWRGDVAMKRVIVRHIAESTTQRLLLEKGDVDLARNLSPEDMNAVAAKDGTKVDFELRGRIMYFALNQKHPVLSKPKVRMAFKYLVDYNGMVNSFLKGQYAVHQAYLPRTYMGELADKPFSLNVEKAKALLAEAGVKDLTVEMIVRNAQERVEIAQSLQNTFAKAGIKSTIQTGTGKQILGIYRARKHQIYVGAWGPDYPDPHTNADTFASNPDNSDEAKLTGKLAWRNAWDIPQMTKETKLAVQELDRNKRAAMYVKSQKEFQQKAPFVIMFQKNEPVGRRSNVKNFVMGGAISSAYYWKVTK